MKLFTSFLKERRAALLAYPAALLLLMWLYVALFPSVQDQAQSFNQLIQQMPEGLRSAFGAEAFDYGNLGSYLSSELYGFLWPVLLAVVALSWAAGALAGEVERGTVEILLAQPVSRLRVYAERYLSGLLALILFALASTLPLIPLARAYGVSLDGIHPWRTTLLCLLFAWAIYGLAFLASAALSEKGRVYAAGAGLLLAMYVCNIAATLSRPLQDLRYVSFFYYFNPAQALVHGQVMAATYWVFVVAALGASLLGAWYWARRDIAA